MSKVISVLKAINNQSGSGRIPSSVLLGWLCYLAFLDGPGIGLRAETEM